MDFYWTSAQYSFDHILCPVFCFQNPFKSLFWYIPNESAYQILEVDRSRFGIVAGHTKIHWRAVSAELDLRVLGQYYAVKTYI